MNEHNTYYQILNINSASEIDYPCGSIKQIYSDVI